MLAATSKDMKTLLYIFVTIIFAFSCKESKKTDYVNESDRTKQINRDSLINALNQYAVTYFKNNSIDSIVTLNGKPNYIKTIQWGDGKEDSLLKVGYGLLRFNFWKPAHLSKPELESIYLFDKNVRLPGQLTIGSTTRQEIIQRLGLPDGDHNDPGRSMTKSGDTTVYGTQSGAGDTVTFTYLIINEFAVHFAMTKDTLRKIEWSKNVF
jgi:hypothetical protein